MSRQKTTDKDDKDVSIEEDGVKVDVPVSPFYLFIINLLITVISHYGYIEINNRNEFHYLPKFTSLAMLIIGRIFFSACFLYKGYMVQKEAKEEMEKHNVNPKHGNIIKKLVTTGIFRASRNPSYVGGVLTALGFSIIFDNYLTLVGVLTIYIYLQLFVIPMEEQALSSHFEKEYQTYRQYVPRWMLNEYF